MNKNRSYPFLLFLSKEDLDIDSGMHDFISAIPENDLDITHELVRVKPPFDLLHSARDNWKSSCLGFF